MDYTGYFVQHVLRSIVFLLFLYFGFYILVDLFGTNRNDLTGSFVFGLRFVLIVASYLVAKSLSKELPSNKSLKRVIIYLLVVISLSTLVSLPISFLPLSWVTGIPFGILMKTMFNNFHWLVIGGFAGQVLGNDGAQQALSYTRTAPPPIPENMLSFSPEQVVAKLGMPKQVINLGSKLVYIYENLKVVFIDGKVVDVQ